MSPPGVATTPTTTGGTMSAEERDLRDAHAILDGCGYRMGPSKVARLVRRYQTTVARNGWALFDYIAAAIQLDAEQRRRALLNPAVARVITYADPTGETAVRNVMRGAR